MATEQTVLAVIRAARPSFRSRHDKVAFAVHAAFVSAGYVLHVAGPPAFADDALASSTAVDEVGVDNWNEFDDNYGFVYSNPENGNKRVLVKCLVMNDSLLIDALEEGDDSEPLHLEVDFPEYVVDNGGTNYGSQFKNLRKLVADVNKEILGKLSGSPATKSSSQPSRSETSLRDDRHGCGMRFYPPENFYASTSSERYVVPPLPGFGGSDLITGYGARMYPWGDSAGGSMLVGPHDRRFFGGRTGDHGLPGGQPDVPPGAGFDPYGPPIVPGFRQGRFIRIPERPSSIQTCSSFPVVEISFKDADSDF